MIDNSKYIKIIKTLIKYYDISEEQFEIMLRNRENRYILLLLLKDNNCINVEKLKKLLNLRSRISIINNLNKAEEKLLVNKEFRDYYFELDNMLKKSKK